MPGSSEVSAVQTPAARGRRAVGLRVGHATLLCLKGGAVRRVARRPGDSTLAGVLPGSCRRFNGLHAPRDTRLRGCPSNRPPSSVGRVTASDAAATTTSLAAAGPRLQRHRTRLGHDRPGPRRSRERRHRPRSRGDEHADAPSRGDPSRGRAAVRADPRPERAAPGRRRDPPGQVGGARGVHRRGPGIPRGARRGQRDGRPHRPGRRGPPLPHARRQRRSQLVECDRRRRPTRLVDLPRRGLVRPVGHLGARRDDQGRGRRRRRDDARGGRADAGALPRRAGRPPGQPGRRGGQPAPRHRAAGRSTGCTPQRPPRCAPGSLVTRSARW